MLCEDTDSESSQTEAPPPRHVSVFLVIFVGAVMMSGIRHPYLWAQDEPREAEIARETLVDGHWVTPHLCGLPFLEKPPLYYDLVAAAYAVTGSISPTTARAVSAAFGMIMLAGMFFLCRRWAGLRAAFLAVLVILSMPKFYYYSHLILLDIAVGAFCTVAMTAFAFWLWWPGSSAKKQTLLCLFYLASAGAFMTKGVVGIFHVIVIIAVFCIITWQWQTLRKLIFAWPIFIFILPAAVWVYLFYREGGIPYLYEHFVNNTVGRFLRVQFALRNVHFHHTDLGKAGSWHFYITSLPVILGASIALVPLAIWNAAAKAWAGWQNHTQSRNPQDDMQFLLLTWAISRGQGNELHHSFLRRHGHFDRRMARFAIAQNGSAAVARGRLAFNCRHRCDFEHFPFGNKRKSLPRYHSGFCGDYDSCFGGFTV
jgi:4-amino-4-deoxy-L-arabinose transferase-like glycosyltransferase